MTDQAERRQAQLRDALNRYVVARGEQHRRRSSAPDRELVTARLALVQLLRDAGWEPPAAVRASLEADARSLDTSDRRSA